jgi:hypothetical protein
MLCPIYLLWLLLRATILIIVGMITHWPSQMLGVWPRSDMETQTVARMSLSEAKTWVHHLDPARWSVLVLSLCRYEHRGYCATHSYTLSTRRWWKAVPTPYLSAGRWTLVRGMLTVDPAARLDAASALHQFDACWSLARAATPTHTPAKQSTSPVPQHHAK